jgi:hypothetical protein
MVIRVGSIANAAPQRPIMRITIMRITIMRITIMRIMITRIMIAPHRRAYPITRGK